MRPSGAAALQSLRTIRLDCSMLGNGNQTTWDPALGDRWLPRRRLDEPRCDSSPDIATAEWSRWWERGGGALSSRGPYPDVAYTCGAISLSASIRQGAVGSSTSRDARCIDELVRSMMSLSLHVQHRHTDGAFGRRNLFRRGCDLQLCVLGFSSFASASHGFSSSVDSRDYVSLSK